MSNSVKHRERQRKQYQRQVGQRLRIETVRQAVETVLVTVKAVWEVAFIYCSVCSTIIIIVSILIVVIIAKTISTTAFNTSMVTNTSRLRLLTLLLILIVIPIAVVNCCYCCCYSVVADVVWVFSAVAIPCASHDYNQQRFLCSNDWCHHYRLFDYYSLSLILPVLQPFRDSLLHNIHRRSNHLRRTHDNLWYCKLRSNGRSRSVRG